MGNRKVQGIGWIETDCPACKGTGSVFNPAKLSDSTNAIKNASQDAVISIDGAHNSTAEPFTKIAEQPKNKKKSVSRGARA